MKFIDTVNKPIQKIAKKTNNKLTNFKKDIVKKAEKKILSPVPIKNIIKKNISIDLPIAIGIIVLFIVTTWEIFFTGGAGYCDSLSGLIFFLLLGKWFQSKTYEALSFERNYKSYFPIAVTKINKQIEESILLEKIKVDDELIIRSKELIPADSILP